MIPWWLAVLCGAGGALGSRVYPYARAELRHWAMRLGYVIRPYSDVADARYWRWRGRPKCGSQVWAELPQQVRDDLTTAVAEFSDRTGVEIGTVTMSCTSQEPHGPHELRYVINVGRQGGKRGIATCPGYPSRNRAWSP